MNINQLDAVDGSTLSAGDLLAVWSQANGDTRKCSITALSVRLQAILAGGSAGVTDHALLNNLYWANSGHTGTPNTVATFSGTGAPTLTPISSLSGSGGSFEFVTSTNSGNDYTITLPAPSSLNALTPGDEFTWKVNAANTGLSTLTVIGNTTLGPISLVKFNGKTLAAGELPAGAVVQAVYDGTNFQVTGLLAGAPQVRIVVIGDSESSENTLLSNPWPDKLKTALDGLGCDVGIITLGISGHSFFRANTVTSFGGLTAVEMAIRLQPTIILVMLGLNDSITNVDSRTLAQTKADAATLFSDLSAGVPGASLVYVAEQPYDSLNFTSSTLKNKGVVPYSFTLPTAGILTGMYCSEMLDDAVSAGTKTLYANWIALDTYVRGLSQVVGSITVNLWKIARLGCSQPDGLHYTQMGHRLITGYVVEGLRAMSFSATVFPTFSQQTTAVLYNTDSLFGEVLTVSGDGYITNTSYTVTSQRVALEDGPIHTLDAESWFFPYKTHYIKYPLTHPADDTVSTSNIVRHGPPLKNIFKSINGAAFVDLGVGTDNVGEFFNFQPGTSQATALGGPGTYMVRYQIGNEVYGPFTVVVQPSTFPYLKVRLVAATAMTDQVVPYDTVDADTGGGWNAGSHSYIVPNTGVYDLKAHSKVLTTGGVGSVGALVIYVGGIRVLDGMGPAFTASGPVELSWGFVGATMQLTAGNAVQIFIVTSGNSDTSSPGVTNGANFLTMQRVA